MPIHESKAPIVIVNKHDEVIVIENAPIHEDTFGTEATQCIASL